MRVFLASAIFAAFAVSTSAASSQTQPSASADAKPATQAKYSTEKTEIGVLLDDPVAKAILEKIFPGMTTNDQIDQARAMTLKDIQQYAPDDITDAKLAAVDAEFAKLPK